MKPTTEAMMRTQVVELPQLERIINHMREHGANSDHVQRMTDLFYESEKARLASLTQPPVTRQALDFDIEVTEGARYFKQPRRRFDPVKAAAIEKYVEQQVQLQRYRYVDHADVDCISNFTLPLKPDGTFRPCGDYVQLNDITQRPRHHREDG